MTHVTRKSGSEGPKHDPYSYEEFSVEKDDGRTAVLHLGLGEWLILNGKKKTVDDFLPDPAEMNGIRNAWDVARQIASNRMFIAFEEVLGITLKSWTRAEQKLHSRCPKCKGHDLERVSGYPGETFLICSKCKEIVDSHFNEAAII
jgi:hypothetical protein